MLPRHPGWEEFIQRLAGPKACNFDGDHWTCSGDLRFVKRILRDVGLDDASIRVSTAYCKDHGAFCDCEVVFMGDRTR